MTEITNPKPVYDLEERTFHGLDSPFKNPLYQIFKWALS